MNPEEYKAHFDMEDRHWWYRGKRTLLEDLVRRFQIKKHMKILDMGCGTGAEATLFRQFGDVTSMDISKIALDMNRVRGIRNLVQASCTQIPAQNQSFDLAVASEVLEHIGDDGKACSELQRILKPGGLLVLTVPAHPILYSEHDRRVQHVRRYRKKELKTLIQSSGLNICEFGSFNVLLAPPIFLVRALEKILPLGKSNQTMFTQTPINNIGNTLMALERGGRAFLKHFYGISYFVVAEKTNAE